jgi:hypothetical protein
VVENPPLNGGFSTTPHTLLRFTRRFVEVSELPEGHSMRGAVLRTINSSSPVRRATKSDWVKVWVVAVLSFGASVFTESEEIHNHEVTVMNYSLSVTDRRLRIDRRQPKFVP